jgi:uncharacterized protein
LLFKLLPGLRHISGNHDTVVDAGLSLHVQVLEKSPHTLTIELNHHFGNNPGELILPRLKIRLYLDAQLAEVLSDHARPDVVKAVRGFKRGREVLNYKWRLNLFLHKWLEHCLAHGGQNERTPNLAVSG